MSLLALTLLAALLISQLIKYSTIKAVSTLQLIDPSLHSVASDPKINITLGVDFFRVPCSLLKVETQDMMGNKDREVPIGRQVIS